MPQAAAAGGMARDAMGSVEPDPAQLLCWLRLGLFSAALDAIQRKLLLRQFSFTEMGSNFHFVLSQLRLAGRNHSASCLCTYFRL
jgi:hypothetical protein